MAPFSLKPAAYYLKLVFSASLISVLGILLLAGVLIGTALTTPLKHPVCCQTPASFGADYETISFTTADGLTLRGWYIPPQNGAVIILLHPYYGDRSGTLPVAEMLAKHGYGLLLYDQRASGESEGSVRSLGRLDLPDLAQAAKFVITRQKNTKIGAYGCSMGGAIALAGSIDAPEIQAIVADAPSPLGWDEYRPAFSLRDPLNLPLTALYFTFINVRTQTPPPPSLRQVLPALGERPLLLISTGQGGEFQRANSLLEAASGPGEHWNLPTSSHCAALGTHPAEYEQHLVEFFDTYLSSK